MVEIDPENGYYPNTLGYICYYGYHTGQRNYVEARKWFEKGADLSMIESMYKLADMFKDGLGGEKYPDRAHALYYTLYRYCRDQFECGDASCKFADVALRMGKIFHEGIHGEAIDMKALEYALEAQFALDKRKPLHHFGDETVGRNIQALIASLEKPDKNARHALFYDLGLGLIPMLFINENHQMLMNIQTSDAGLMRFDIRRIRSGHQASNPILLAVPPAMKCFMTKSIVIYGENIEHYKTRNHKQTIVCDRYAYDQKRKWHKFYYKRDLQCYLKGGHYMLSMAQLNEECKLSPNTIMN